MSTITESDVDAFMMQLDPNVRELYNEIVFKLHAQRDTLSDEFQLLVSMREAAQKVVQLHADANDLKR